MFYHQSHIWKNSGCRVMVKNAVGQSNCRIQYLQGRKIQYLKEEVSDEFFLACREKSK